jgi:hypothetical protein
MFKKYFKNIKYKYNAYKFRKTKEKETANVIAINNEGVYYEEKSKFTYKHPETLADARFRLNAGDTMQHRQAYNSVSVKVNNEWNNYYQSVNLGYGTAQNTFFQWQPVNYYENYILTQDPLIKRIIDILSNSVFSKWGRVESIKEDVVIDNSVVLEAESKYKLKKLLPDILKKTYTSGGCFVFLDFQMDKYDVPFDYNRLGNKKRLKAFKIIEPINCTPLSVNTTNPAEDNYMEPDYWYIIGLGKVHKSYLIDLLHI